VWEGRVDRQVDDETVGVGLRSRGGPHTENEQQPDRRRSDYIEEPAPGRAWSIAGVGYHRRWVLVLQPVEPRGNGTASIAAAFRLSHRVGGTS